MIIEKILCDICKNESKDPTLKSFHWTDTFGVQCSLNLKNVPAIQTNIEWKHLCPNCGRAILEAVTKVVKERFVEIK